MSPTTQPSAAIRSCVACRRRAPRAELLRTVADQAGRLRVDVMQRAPGRGAYLCAEARCFQAACQRGALARGLRRRLVPVTATDFRRVAGETVRATAEQAVRQGLEDGRVRRGEGVGTVVIVDDRLSRRLQQWAEQVRRLEAEAVEDPKRADGSSETEVRHS